MSISWTESLPIYRQLVEEIVRWIILEKVEEGSVLPSTRKLASQFDVNPLTAHKAYQELTAQEILGKKRGVGLFVKSGTRKKLIKQRRANFLTKEWPQVLRKIELLEVDVDKLIDELSRLTS